jgi:hypothetical protein
MSDGFKKNLSGREKINPKLDLQIGAFIFYQKTRNTIFRDAQQHEVTLDRVLFLTREWDFQNGEKNLPKPYLIDESGAIREYGASVLYSYLNSTDARVVVFGPVQDLTLNHVDAVLNPQPTDYDKIQEKQKSRNNDNRFYSFTEDGQGNLFLYLKGKKTNGNVGIKIEGDQAANGNFSLSLNGKFALNLQTADGKTTYTQLLFDNTKDDEKFKLKDKHGNIILANKTGLVFETATVRVGKDETLKKILDDLITAICAMTNNSPGGPTISPPMNKAQFDAITQRLSSFMDTQ